MIKFYSLLLLILVFSTYTFAQNIGIGTAVPQSKLSVKGGLSIGSNYADNNAAPTDGLIIEGNVGIGEPSPSDKLDVAGNIRANAFFDRDNTSYFINPAATGTSLNVAGDIALANSDARIVGDFNTHNFLGLDEDNLSIGSANHVLISSANDAYLTIDANNNTTNGNFIIGSNTANPGDASWVPLFRINETGETWIEGQLDLQGNKIVDLADPTTAQEAATKAYVDGRTGGNETDPIWTSDKSDYYTIGNLQTSGQSSVHWNNLTNVPAGLNDGDDNTTYSAGNDLTLSGTTFSLEDDIDVTDIRAASGGKVQVHDLLDVNDNHVEEAYSIKFSNKEFDNTYFNEDAYDYGRLAWDRSEGFKYFNDYPSADHWATMWDSDNDGAGSGMDADRLDGEQGSYYLDWNNLNNIPASISNGDNQDLADVLGQGNSAGSNGINMNNQNITNVNYLETDGYIELTGSNKVMEFDGGANFITIHDGFGNFNILSGLDDNNNVVGNSSGGTRLEMSESGYFDFETYDASANKVGHMFLDQTEAYFNNVNVGIGQTSPSAKLDVVGTTELNGDLTVIGTSDFTGNVNVNGNINLNDSGDDINIDDPNNVVHNFGYNDGTYGISLRTTSNPPSGEAIFKVLSSGLAERLRVEHNGAVYMSNVLEVAGSGDSYIAGNLAVNATSISGGYNLYVNGRIGTNGINETSDRRYKTNIETVDRALEKVNQLRGVYYDWRQDEFPEKEFEKGRQLGVIAQEIEAVLPEVVHTDDKGYKSVEYGHLAPVLIEAVNELSAKVNAQEKELTALRAQQKDMEVLKAKNTALRNDVEAIKEMLLMQACK